jgi:hypothetical protein
MIEITMKFIFLFKSMIKSKLEIFDAITVYLAFIIEMVFLGLNNKALESLGGIIILFRLIKILRIAKGRFKI